jgi:hypothetical protein
MPRKFEPWLDHPPPMKKFWRRWQTREPRIYADNDHRDTAPSDAGSKARRPWWTYDKD